MSEKLPSISYTVKLTDRSVAAMEDVAKLLGLRQVDVVNRALQLYAYLEMEKATGEKLVLRAPDGSTCRVHMDGDPDFSDQTASATVEPRAGFWRQVLHYLRGTL